MINTIPEPIQNQVQGQIRPKSHTHIQTQTQNTTKVTQVTQFTYIQTQIHIQSQIPNPNFQSLAIFKSQTTSETITHSITKPLPIQPSKLVKSSTTLVKK
ncbi:hypothetical protein Taro_044583, partial [Colocasia esculenta]|nr:hypothetical protein [Colocasia esculenta]